MSRKEQQRIKMIENVVDGTMTIGRAAGLLNPSERQVEPLKRRFERNLVDGCGTGIEDSNVPGG